MSISIRSIIVRHIIAFVVVFSVTLLVVATANAHTFNPPFLWYSSTAKFQNFTANYNAGVNSATNDYNATDLTVTKVSNLSGRDVVNFYDYNGGRDYPIGRAVAWATVNGTSVL